MKVAHLSDLHVLALDGASPTRFLGKRLTGYANLKFKRKHVHHPELVQAILREIRLQNPDHVVITGDLTNLALEGEFAAVRQMLDSELGFSPDRISAIPGNHDAYTRGAHRSGRMRAFFNHIQGSDLPELAADLAMGPYPFVKLRGPLAIIGLCSAVPRPPFMAAGTLGKPQMEALKRILAHAEVATRAVLVLVHHPPYAPAKASKAWLEGLHDQLALREALAHHPRVVVAHGHLHSRLTSTHGNIQVFGATSASLAHDALDRHAGFNLYTWNDIGDLTEAIAYVETTGTFIKRPIPQSHWK